MTLFARSFFFVLAMVLSLASMAETGTRYVAPGQAVELRSGLAKKDKTVRTLEPGTTVKILQTNVKLGYTKVKLPSGETGWIVTRQLTQVPPPPPQPEAQQAVSTTNQTALPVAKTPEQLQAEVGHLQTELIAIRQASASALRIQAERDQLQSSVISLRKEVDTLLREKNALNDDQKQSWFLIGAGVLLGGMLLGAFLPRLSFMRRNDWSSF
jgi:SH3 domain protein